MKMAQIFWLFQTFLGFLDEDTRDEILDAALDLVEDKIRTTETQMDDRFILPMIRLLRDRFDIPDE